MTSPLYRLLSVRSVKRTNLPLLVINETLEGNVTISIAVSDLNSEAAKEHFSKSGILDLLTDLGTVAVGNTKILFMAAEVPTKKEEQWLYYAFFCIELIDGKLLTEPEKVCVDIFNAPYSKQLKLNDVCISEKLTESFSEEVVEALSTNLKYLVKHFPVVQSYC